MARQRTYTLDEIERETGFDKRTIAYYVQEELLPKVGRRGPRTRYPRAYLDRLLFIRRIRELQDQGQLGSVTLGDIRQIFDEQSERSIADLVAGRRPLESALPGDVAQPGSGDVAPAAHRAEMMWRARHRRSGIGDDEVAKLPMPPESQVLSHPSAPPCDEDSDSSLVLELDSGPPVFELREISELASSATIGRDPRRGDIATIARLLRSLSEAAAPTGRGRRRSSEHWTRARIMPGLSISARNLDDGDAPLLERLAVELRRLVPRSGGDDE